jgi:hypothetical protein
MNNDDLIQFNPILAKAPADVEAADSNPNFNKEILRELVAAAIKTGMPPDKIYAVIKTGRILTFENMKFLSNDEIDEWQDAAREYDELANPNSQGTGKSNAISRKFKLEIEVTVKDEEYAIEVARKMYAEGSGASEPIDDTSEEERFISPEEYIEDIEAALIELVHINPLLEQAGIEVTELSAGRIEAKEIEKADEN